MDMSTILSKSPLKALLRRFALVLRHSAIDTDLGESPTATT
jgi:hypothetical protein